MAAIATRYKDILEFDFPILNDQDDEALLRAIEVELSAQANHNYSAYVRASRSSRNKRKEGFLCTRTFKSSRIIDVTGISKELTAEIMAIALATGKSMCSLSWTKRIDGTRQVI